MKTIDTLVADIKEVLTTSKGYNSEIRDFIANNVSESLDKQFGGFGDNDKPRLRFSSMGTPCERKLWYSVNRSDSREPISSSLKLRFTYGDLIESLVLGLAKAAGHRVEGLQASVAIDGVRGSTDAIIDGMLIDVKSATDRSMQKFRDGGLRSDDSFGYISQLSSYLFALQDDPLLEVKDKAGFLVVDKSFGKIELHIYDLSEDMKGKLEEVKHKKRIVKQKEPPARAFEPVPDGKSGNTKLGLNCSYCDFRYSCWPNLRTFLYSNGPRYLVDVVREPNAWEVK
jgi:hypothetical protein